MKRIMIMAVLVTLVVLAALVIANGGNPERFGKAVRACNNGWGDAVVLSDNGRTVHFKVKMSEDTRSNNYMACVLTKQLKMPYSTALKMYRTIQSDGVQSDSWDGIEATWTADLDLTVDVIAVDKS